MDFPTLFYMLNPLDALMYIDEIRNLEVRERTESMQVDGLDQHPTSGSTEPLSINQLKKPTSVKLELHSVP
jgi:hypothetical protein